MRPRTRLHNAAPLYARATRARLRTDQSGRTMVRRTTRGPYGREYFDKWYRHPRHRVATTADVQRRAALALAVAEWVLGRPVRSVLDVGCGEAPWRAALRRVRPRVRYTGVDASPYVVARYGRRRAIRLGTFGGLDAVADHTAYDLIVCVDVLHLIDAPEVARGLHAVRERLGGVAYLSAFTSADAFEGDVRAVRRRAPAWYRRRFRDAGLVPVGLECYVTRDLLPRLAALERPAAT